MNRREFLKVAAGAAVALAFGCRARDGGVAFDGAVRAVAGTGLEAWAVPETETEGGYLMPPDLSEAVRRWLDSGRPIVRSEPIFFPMHAKVAGFYNWMPHPETEGPEPYRRGLLEPDAPFEWISSPVHCRYLWDSSDLTTSHVRDPMTMTQFIRISCCAGDPPMRRVYGGQIYGQEDAEVFSLDDPALDGESPGAVTGPSPAAERFASFGEFLQAVRRASHPTDPHVDARLKPLERPLVARDMAARDDAETGWGVRADGEGFETLLGFPVRWV